MYKSIHGTHKIGRYWLNIENLTERSHCTTCDKDKTMEHILTGCPANIRSTVWTEANDIWPYDNDLWPQITPGIILGCGLLEIRSKNQPPNQNHDKHTNEPTVNTGATRLAKILISKAAYLIWMLCCGRVISDKTYTADAIKTMWRRTLNRRLAEDITAATKIVRKEEHTKMVHHTWYAALKKKYKDLLEDWMKLQPHFQKATNPNLKQHQ